MEKTINIFGSSIAWGACDNELGGWTNRLRLELEKEKHRYFEVYNLGISGEASDNLLKRFSIENEVREPNIMMIETGINDSQYIKSADSRRIPLEIFE